MIYFDYISSLKITQETAKFTGGENYAKTILKAIKNQKKYKKELTILLPSQRLSVKREDRDLIYSFNVECISDITKYKFNNDSTLFMPQVNGTTLKKASLIKQSNPKLKIYGTLHDRQHNYRSLDIYDLYYKSNLLDKIQYIMLFHLKRLYFDAFYTRWISSFDKIFTVSNYSLQMLKNKKIKNINFYFQSSIFEDYNALTVDHDIDDNYALFVGGNRPEKNLLRTIEAFCKFAEKNNDLKLYVTGIEDNLIDRFSKHKNLDLKLISERVKVFNYVSTQELGELYRRCKFVLFTSKGEGFGLPVLEAILYNKPVLASYETSIPEVGGSVVKYINPYEINSIASGISYMCEEKNRKFLLKIIREKRDVIKKQIEIDKIAIINEIFN